MCCEGHQNLHKSLNQYIPTAATLGGLCIGALCVFADHFGVLLDSGANRYNNHHIRYTVMNQIVKEQSGQSHNYTRLLFRTKAIYTVITYNYI
ncbi:Protein transport protein Sec61 subunit alpha [Geodia barretti]|uniref:Protein transport protein Sec61 subunit alpha n=1 Tax=Geodia barretti TaxID=519541 RepID=A0AA35TYP6_GEOBA|nr:Protein transport protein Sec61 subunit alpha [Geodia barretti]